MSDYSPEIERDEQGRAARVVFRQDDPQYGEAPDSGVTPHGDTQAAIPRCVCGKPSARKGRFCSRHCKDRAYNAAHPVARQRPLPLDPEPQPVPPVVDERLDLTEEGKLRGDNALVLRRLRLGPAYGRDLERLLGPGSAWRTRVSDVRRWLRREGETIRAHREASRLWRYQIEAHS
jgi:hypothetical protein